jgi:GAF domain-containing protein
MRRALMPRRSETILLYEQAIRSAREQGFLQNEGLAYELAARFYAARGFEAFADLYLRSARHCYQRWGADGKVRQLTELYPRVRENEPALDSRGTSGAPVEQLELATVLKVSQAVSGEMILDRLLERLMRAAIEHAGAEDASSQSLFSTDPYLVRHRARSVLCLPWLTRSSSAPRRCTGKTRPSAKTLTSTR